MSKKKDAQTITDVRVTLAWYTAWLIASGTRLKKGTDCNAVADAFLSEDEDMVRRFFRLPQRKT